MDPAERVDRAAWSPDRDDAEWSLQFDMRERGRRLRELAKATEGMVLTEITHGTWRYVPVLTHLRPDA